MKVFSLILLVLFVGTTHATPKKRAPSSTEAQLLADQRVSLSIVGKPAEVLFQQLEIKVQEKNKEGPNVGNKFFVKTGPNISCIQTVLPDPSPDQNLSKVIETFCRIILDKNGLVQSGVDLEP